MLKHYKVAYICDQNKCDKCGTECNHTTNPNNALHKDKVTLFEEFIDIAKDINKYFEINANSDCIAFTERMISNGNDE